MRAEFLYEAEFLMAALRSRSPAAQLGQGCRPEGRLGCGCSPHRRALRSRRPPAIGGPVRGAYGPPSLSPTPARPRAPPAAVGGKARANNRGLAGKEKEAEPVMEEFNCGERGRSPNLPRVSQKFNGAVSPLVVNIWAHLPQCRKSNSFATLVLTLVLLE